MIARIGEKSGEALRAYPTELNTLPASNYENYGSGQSAVWDQQRVIELYKILKPPLHVYLWHLGLSTEQAEDVIQDTFLRLVSSRFDGNGQDNLRAWIFRVARNLSMDIHRTQRRWSRNSGDEALAVIRQRIDPAPSPEQRMLIEERMRLFERTFSRLTEKQRQCVMLRAKGFRYREIASTLGVSVPRVGELMQRSIVLLEADS